MNNRSILVFLPNYIGDIMMATPALHLLKAMHPNARIGAVTTRAGRELLDHNPDVDDIYIRKARPGLTDRLRLFQRVRAFKPDTVLLFRSTFFNALLGFLSGARCRAGIRNAESRIFLTHSLDAEPFRKFREQYIAVVSLLVPSVDNGTLSRIPRIFTEEPLTEVVLPDNYIVLMAGSTRQSKKWSHQKFASLIDRVQQEQKYTVVLVGSDEDTPDTRTIIELATAKPMDLTGKTTLKQLVSVIRNAKLFIGPDTGALYIAEAAGVPTLALFGSTSPDKCGPFAPHINIIYKNIPCSPCHRNNCPKVNEGAVSLCMDAISINEVMNAFPALP